MRSCISPASGLARPSSGCATRLSSWSAPHPSGDAASPTMLRSLRRAAKRRRVPRSPLATRRSLAPAPRRSMQRPSTTHVRTSPWPSLLTASASRASLSRGGPWPHADATGYKHQAGCLPGEQLQAGVQAGSSRVSPSSPSLAHHTGPRWCLPGQVSSPAASCMLELWHRWVPHLPVHQACQARDHRCSHRGHRVPH